MCGRRIKVDKCSTASAVCIGNPGNGQDRVDEHSKGEVKVHLVDALHGER